MLNHLDPISKIPGYKQIGVKIEKVSAELAEELTRKAQDNELDYYMNEEPETIRYKESAMEALMAEQADK